MIERLPDDAGFSLSSSLRDRPVRLVFAEPQHPHDDDDLIEYLVKVESYGLRVESPVLSLAGGDGLPGFLDDLADQFRGWTGVRSWRSLEDQLRVEGTWADRGHVTLRFIATPSVYDSWEVAVSFNIEAGAELQALASATACFFSK